MPLEDLVADQIVIGLDVFRVVAAIDLNCEASRVADEIEEVALEGSLAAEVEPTIPKAL